jgi:predicted nucleic acid-binding Zn ribbon protein
MPYYLFSHPKTETVIEIFQHMNEPHVYVDEFGVQWNRVFTRPNAAIDTQVDPFSQKDFSKSTSKKGTIGDLMDHSAEMAIKRQEKDGIDHVQEKYYSDWSKKRNGKIHPNKRMQINDNVTKELLSKQLDNL